VTTNHGGNDEEKRGKIAVQSTEVVLRGFGNLAEGLADLVGAIRIVSPAEPPWVSVLYQHLRTTVFQPMVSAFNGGNAAYRFGYSIGMMRWLAASLPKAFERMAAASPVAAKLDAESEAKIQELFGAFLVKLADLSPEEAKDPEKALVQLAGKVLRAVRKELVDVGKPLKETQDFFHGIADGVIGICDENGGFRNNTDATLVHFYLVLFWQEVICYRSVAELHGRLRLIMGPRLAGKLKRIEAICRRLEIKFRKPGRPRKFRH
jgi:hypothetical protein